MKTLLEEDEIYKEKYDYIFEKWKKNLLIYKLFWLNISELLYAYLIYLIFFLTLKIKN